MDRRDAEKLLGLEKRTYTSDELRTAVAAMRNVWKPDGVLSANTDPRVAAVMRERIEEAAETLEEDAHRATESHSEPQSDPEPDGWAQGEEEGGSVPHSAAGGVLHAIAGRVRTVSLVLIVIFAGLLATCIESAVRAALAGDPSAAAMPSLLGAAGGVLAFHEWRTAGLARAVCRLCGRLAVGADEGRLDIPIAVLRALAKVAKVVGGFLFRWLKRYLTS